MANFVIKRDGTKEDFDILKIKKSIAMACDGVDVNPLELESKIDVFMKNGIKTSDIQKNVIQHAIQLASMEVPQWLNVAGRAMAMDEWASHKDKNFYDYIKSQCRAKVYSKDLLKFYTKDQIVEIGNMIKLERDLDHSISSLVTGKKKYFAKNEMNQYMHMVNAMRFGQAEPEETRLNFVKETYDILSMRKFSLATPFMSNLREGGNVASCFIISIEDDLDSIFENVHRIAKISKNGGGLGIFLGFLRASGSPVNGMPNAAGSVVRWVKIINDTLVAVNQGGKRQGAGTVALPIWHNDIYDFINMQTERGDLRLKAYDVQPQVTVPDIFMERDKKNLPWTTFCPYEVREVLGIDVRGLHGEKFTEAYLEIEKAAEEGKLSVFRVNKTARDITKMIMKTQFETGLPYLSFTDTMNRVNPNKNDPEAYGILCANLCVESYSNVVPDVYGHVCNLGSINMGNISDFDELAKVARVACRILNHGISLTNSPDEITTKHNERYRTIGIGVMGVHDYLAREKLNYSKLDVLADISETIEYNAVLESIELVDVYGKFGAFEHSMWKSGEMIEHFKSVGGKLDWDAVQKMIDEKGICNSQMTSPAPTTSTSIYQDASATYLPVFSPYFLEDNKNGSLPVSSKFLADNPLGYSKSQTKFSMKEIIDVTAEFQKFVDTGISMELYMDHNLENFSAKDVYDAIHHAYDKKLKTIYYIRTKKKNEEVCPSCAG